MGLSHPLFALVCLRFESVSQSVSVVVLTVKLLASREVSLPLESRFESVVQNLIKCFELLWLSSAWLPRTRQVALGQ